MSGGICEINFLSRAIRRTSLRISTSMSSAQETLNVPDFASELFCFRGGYDFFLGPRGAQGVFMHDSSPTKELVQIDFVFSGHGGQTHPGLLRLQHQGFFLLRGTASSSLYNRGNDFNRIHEHLLHGISASTIPMTNAYFQLERVRFIRGVLPRKWSIYKHQPPAEHCPRSS